MSPASARPTARRSFPTMGRQITPGGRTDRAQGSIVMGKSNTPEFGAGGATFNEVFGRSAIPGIPGGPRAVPPAAAPCRWAGEVWLAHGSDHGG